MPRLSPVPVLLTLLGGCTWITADEIAAREARSGDTGETGDTGDSGDSVESGESGESGETDTATDTAQATILGDAAGDLAGWSVVSAGDVNADGAADLIVGTPGASLGLGGAVVAYGPFSGELQLSAVGATLTGPSDGGYAGQSVAAPGDLDADGYADVLVGAPDREALESRNCGVGVAYVAYGPVSDGALDSADGIRAGPDDNGCFGFAVAAVADLSGDGYPDLALGSPGLGDPANYGTVYLVTGASSRADSSDMMALVDGAGQLGGYAVAGRGDLTGDGADDLVVGGPGSDGQVWLLAGPLPDGALMEDAAYAVLLGPASRTYFGSAVAILGDADGDGANDVAIGARSATVDSDTAAGVVWLVAGVVAGTDAVADVATAQVQGAGEGQSLGYFVGAAGDLDGDDLADLSLGAPASNDASSSAGTAWWVHGGISGTVGIESDGVGISGQSGDRAGLSVARIDNADGHTVDGFAVGAPGRDAAGLTDAGLITVFSAEGL